MRIYRKLAEIRFDLRIADRVVVVDDVLNVLFFMVAHGRGRLMPFSHWVKTVSFECSKGVSEGLETSIVVSFQFFQQQRLVDHGTEGHRARAGRSEHVTIVERLRALSVKNLASSPEYGM